MALKGWFWLKWNKLKGLTGDYDMQVVKRELALMDVWRGEFEEAIRVLENSSLEFMNDRNTHERALKEEIRNRQIQMKRHKEKVDKQLKKFGDRPIVTKDEMIKFHALMEDVEQVAINMAAKNKEIDDKLDHMDALSSMLRKGITATEGCVKRFDGVEDLIDNAEKAYGKYLSKLKSDISSYKESDQAIRRLASLETRITNLEMSHGSGETAPGSTGKD